MGKKIILIFLITISLLNFLALSVEGQQDNILRIHIIANSNSPIDQFIKYKVRDAILREFNYELSKLISMDDIEAFIDNNLEEIINVADRILYRYDLDYSARGSIGTFNFPTRLYLNTIYPRGKYKALKIELGQGSGDNWWCVMFPPLCLVGEIKDDTAVYSEGGLASAEVELDFFLVKWFKGLINAIKNLFR